MKILSELHRDAKLLMAARGIRAFAFSYLNVVFAIYLDRLGYTPVMIGMIFTVAYLSGALLTALWGYLSDRVGRRKILMLLALLTICSNFILIFFTSLLFILAAVVIANVGAGGSGGGGSGGGPFNPGRRSLTGRKMPAGKSQSNLCDQFLRGIDHGFLRRTRQWPTAIPSGGPRLELSRLVQAALFVDHRLQHRPPVCLSRHDRAASAAQDGTKDVEKHRSVRYKNVGSVDR